MWGGAQGSFLKTAEKVIGSWTDPAVETLQTQYNDTRSEYPTLSVIGLLLALATILTTYLCWSSRKAKATVSAKERNLNSIPGMASRLERIEQSMVGVTTASLADSSAVLGFSNRLRELGQSLAGITETQETHGRTLSAIYTRTDKIAGIDGKLDQVGSTLGTIEAVTKETREFTRPRANTK